MRLSRLVEQLLSESDVCHDYKNQIKHVALRMQCRMDADPDIADLTPDAINEFLADAMTTRARPTVQGYRRILVRMLNYAAEIGEIDFVNTRRIRKIKAAAPCPTAWTLDEVGRVFDAAKSFGEEWLLYSRIGFETGLRKSDILRLAEVKSEPFAVLDHKTGLPVVKIVRPETERLWHDLDGLRFAVNGRHWFAVAQRIMQKSGVRGTLSKGLRISHESHNPGGLQHRTEQARKHYLDRTIAIKATLPPEI